MGEMKLKSDNSIISKKGKVIVKCKNCGKEFEIFPCQRKLGKKYCSTRCYMDDKRSFFPKPINCLYCNKEFLPSKSSVKCCSKSCALSYRQKEGSWNKGLNVLEATKKKISEGLKRNKEFMKKAKMSLSETTKEKIRNTIKSRGSSKGKNNSNWKGGITDSNRKIRNQFNLSKWREKVLKRDDYVCQMCGESNYILHSHHIISATKFPKLSEDINNGITLCENCHYKTYGKEEKLEQYFYNLLSGNKIITITSTRPCLIRQSLVIKKLDKYFGKNHIHIYTGQNFDKNLYNIFLEDLELKRPDYEFNLKEQYQGNKFIGECMINIENTLKNFSPNNTIINILGDVNGAFASIYVAKRMGFIIVHNEAGNRCYKDILEEINRKSIDTMANKHLCYSQRSRENLLREGYHPKDIIVSGNPLIEVLRIYYKDKDPIIKGNYVLVHIHRTETINDFKKLEEITKALKELSKSYKIIISIHPSLRDKIKKYKNVKKMFEYKNIDLCDPFNYSDYLNIMKNSIVIMSDSGGECEEACFLNKPCLVLRNETERTELIEQSQMILCGTNCNNILRAFKFSLDLGVRGIPEEYLKPTSSIIIKILLSCFNKKQGGD